MGEIIILIMLVGIVFILLLNASNKDIEEKKENEKKAFEEARDFTITDDDTRPLDTVVKQEDLRHEQQKAERERLHAYEMRRQFEAAKQAKENAKRQEEATRKQEPKTENKILKPSIFCFPIMLAVAAMFHMPSWYYTLWKVVVLLEAIILVGIRLNETKFRSESVAIATVFMVIMAAMGIISFMNGGFDRTFWIIMDIAYCIMHCVLYFGLLKKVS